MRLDPGEEAGAQQQVLDGTAQGVFVIPPEFERNVLRGEQAYVSVYGNACYFLIYRQLYTGLYKAATTLSASASGNSANLPRAVSPERICSSCRPVL